ncbi:hypothetical protein pb186bvf_000471 [Paramecium bursaria]
MYQILLQNQYHKKMFLQYLQYAIVPSSNQDEPYRIIFIMDGSGSMGTQYPTMIQVYKKLFSGMNNVEAFQFSSSVGSLEPFLKGGTNIQIAIEQLAKILEQGVLQTNICAAFVSDGDGSENIQTLQARFKELHKRYQISFISLAVGKEFPTQLSNKLRAMIHNASSTLPAIIPVDSNDKFESAFLRVKQLAVQQKQIPIKNQVLRYPWAPPTNQVYPFEIVAVNMKENLIQTSTGIGSYVPNLSISLTFRFIQSSLQQIIQLYIIKDEKILEYIQQMIQYIYAVRNLMEEKRAIHKIALYVDLGKAIVFLENIKSGNLDLTMVGDVKLKEIMLNYTPDKTQTVDSKDSSTSQELLRKAQNQRFDLKSLEQIFTIENKNLLLSLNKIEDRFVKFHELCKGNQQLFKLVQDNQELVFQIIDSQLLFKLEQPK